MGIPRLCDFTLTPYQVRGRLLILSRRGRGNYRRLLRRYAPRKDRRRAGRHRGSPLQRCHCGRSEESVLFLSPLAGEIRVRGFPRLCDFTLTPYQVRGRLLILSHRGRGNFGRLPRRYAPPKTDDGRATTGVCPYNAVTAGAFLLQPVGFDGGVVEKRRTLRRRKTFRHPFEGVPDDGV
jgi:hypothetical protein